MNIGALKIDNTILTIYKIVIAVFSIMNYTKQIRFFKKIFLIAKVGLKVIFEIFFLILNNINVDFLN